MCVGTLSGVTSAGMVISSARSGTLRAAKQQMFKVQVNVMKRKHGCGKRPVYLVREFFTDQRHDQRRLPHFSCGEEQIITQQSSGVKPVTLPMSEY